MSQCIIFLYLVIFILKTGFLISSLFILYFFYYFIVKIYNMV